MEAIEVLTRPQIIENILNIINNESKGLSAEYMEAMAFKCVRVISDTSDEMMSGKMIKFLTEIAYTYNMGFWIENIEGTLTFVIY